MKEHAFFSSGFRPFFLLASYAAVILPTFWISILFNYLDFHGKLFSALHWHSYEMIFAFIPALIAGFFLTASAHWTGKPPVSKSTIVLLFSLWVIERLVLVLPLSKELALLGSYAFLLPFVFIAAKYLIGFPKQFYVFVPFFLMFLASKTIFSLGAYYSDMELLRSGQDFALNLIRFLLVLMTGRVIPFFVRSKFSDIKPVSISIIDKLCLISALLVVVPIDWFEYPLIGTFLYTLAFSSLLIRFMLVKPHKSLKEPMLCVLHIGVVWILINYFFNIMTIINAQEYFAHASLHSLTAGAVGVLGIGIMVRVSLGHTGRVIKADKLTIAAFVSVVIGAALRVFVPIFYPEYYMESLHHASGWWTLGYLFMAYRFTPIWFKPRVDQKL